MQSQAEKLADRPKSEQDAFIASLSLDECEALIYDWRGFNARPNQIAPGGDWDIWLALAGRGFGKTRMGAEWVKEQVEAGCMRIALIAETQKDLEKVMIEGDSGLLSLYPESQRPKYTKKPVEIKWANGAIASGYNATEPNQLRGPQFDAAWGDEIAKWRYARETWDQLQFGLRLGNDPRVFLSTTPRPIQLLKDIIAGQEGEVTVTHGKTTDNRSNLSSKFMKKILKRYEGTRLGRQELDAELLGDIPNALWSLTNIDLYRTPNKPEHFDRIVVAVDPAVTNTERSDAHGIVACGQVGQEGYVLADDSTKGTPEEWARAAISCYDKCQADCIVVEVNQGGDMVASTIKTIRQNIPIREVRASRGKHVRAEPISSLYQQGRVHHVGAFIELETEMTMMTSAGYTGEGSPDRLDALVWGMTELFPSMIREPAKTPPPLVIPRARRMG
ncbi:MAG: ATP-binding protein [SAR86 cluster bacterium]|uniref:ATP-binding protein n=1 Tax=SAR86 cluster bacterium TaxID=2030880 RepID=A0A2A5AXW4_9GAMM|nr:MAG: ATP-binding protein [SAR86 cluster bacterium]